MANPLYQQIKISEPKSYTGEESTVSCMKLFHSNLTERGEKKEIKIIISFCFLSCSFSHCLLFLTKNVF